MLSGCDQLSQKPWFLNFLGASENLTRKAQHLFAGRNTLAPEYSKADIAPVFRANGTPYIADEVSFIRRVTGKSAPAEKPLASPAVRP